MLNVIRMPQMGVSDESAILSKWLVREGDRIRKGQPVFSLETDKATFQYEAESDGYLVRILTGEGEEAAVGSTVGILSDSAVFEESELESIFGEQEKTDARTQSPTGAETGFPLKNDMEPETKCVSVQNPYETRRRISPRAKKKSGELGVNLDTLRSGSGPDGRIIERDVQHFVQANRAGTSEPKAKRIYSGRPLTTAGRISMRPIHAETAGQTGFVSRMIDAKRILTAYTPQNKFKPGTIICHELARLLVKRPELNARRHVDRIYEYNTVHLRLSVKTAFGTLKPVIRCAEAYTPDELAILIRNAADRCKRFVSKPQDFQEGTFGVEDLSAYGMDFFMPELTPPELCTLGIGAVAMQTGNDERGGIKTYPAIRLMLVYDRAGIDAVQAAEFLNELAVRLEPDGEQQ